MENNTELNFLKIPCDICYKDIPYYEYNQHFETEIEFLNKIENREAKLKYINYLKSFNHRKNKANELNYHLLINFEKKNCNICKKNISIYDYENHLKTEKHLKNYENRHKKNI